MKKIALIAAIDSRGGIGINGKLPWSIPEDMKYFKETTKDSTCIMGRKTYEDMLEMMISRKIDIKKHILPTRQSIVVTSNKDYKPKGAIIADSIQNAIDLSDRDSIFIIGGSRIFKDGLKFANTVHITEISKDYKCDVFFPIDEVYTQFYQISTTKLNSNKYINFIIFER